MVRGLSVERRLKSNSKTGSWETWVQLLKFARAVLRDAQKEISSLCDLGPSVLKAKPKQMQNTPRTPTRCQVLGVACGCRLLNATEYRDEKC